MHSGFAHAFSVVPSSSTSAKQNSENKPNLPLNTQQRDYVFLYGAMSFMHSFLFCFSLPHKPLILSLPYDMVQTLLLNSFEFF